MVQISTVAHVITATKQKNLLQTRNLDQHRLDVKWFLRATVKTNFDDIENFSHIYITVSRQKTYRGDTKQGESDFHEGFLKKNFNHTRKPKMAIRVCYNFLFLFQQI